MYRQLYIGARPTSLTSYTITRFAWWGLVEINFRKSIFQNLDPNNNWSYDKSVEIFKHDKNNPNSISSNTVTGLLHDSQDRLWAATWGEEINLIQNVSTNSQPKFKRLRVGDNAYFVFEDSRLKNQTGYKDQINPP